MIDIREHKSIPKELIKDVLKLTNFAALQKDWNIISKERHMVWDRIRVYEDDPENPYEQKDITPTYFVKALLFELKNIGHSSFNFYIYEDYENPNLMYCKNAVYYYGNWVKEYVMNLANPKVQKFPDFKTWCEMLANSGDGFAIHNYKIDMETVDKLNLMR